MLDNNLSQTKNKKMNNNKKHYFELSKDNLVIFHSENDGEFSNYPIVRNQLKLIRNDEDKSSEWIMQILDKSWSTEEMMIELAELIKKEAPISEINWQNTLKAIERRFTIRRERKNQC